jgi:excinuclease ABC subunit C
MAEAPLRIECFDISHLAGSDPVASMVVFEDGLPRTSDYRRFAVRSPGGDDLAAMAEVVGRRFRHLLEPTQPAEPAEGPAAAEDDQQPVAATRPKRFSYRPQLVVVDGGPGQAAAAADVLSELGVTDVLVVGLAKRLEEVWVAGEDAPLILPRGSEGLFLLQRVRDEAHRFAIAYQRQKRGRRTSESVLDAVPGLGETRKRALLRHFGSLKKIRAASASELEEVKGIGPTLAATLAEALAQPTPSGAGEAPSQRINTATGEIID